jgi:hypothetical protein
VVTGVVTGSAGTGNNSVLMLCLDKPRGINGVFLNATAEKLTYQKGDKIPVRIFWDFFGHLSWFCRPFRGFLSFFSRFFHNSPQVRVLDIDRVQRIVDVDVHVDAKAAKKRKKAKKARKDSAVLAKNASVTATVLLVKQGYLVLDVPGIANSFLFISFLFIFPFSSFLSLHFLSLHFLSLHSPGSYPAASGLPSGSSQVSLAFH